MSYYLCIKRFLFNTNSANRIYCRRLKFYESYFRVYTKLCDPFPQMLENRVVHFALGCGKRHLDIASTNSINCG